MDRMQVIEVVVSVVKGYLETQGIECDVTTQTKLFGDDAVLDSMGLVNIVIDVESEFLDQGREISLTSEKAMSRSSSPFRTIETLVDFICEQIHAD